MNYRFQNSEVIGSLDQRGGMLGWDYLVKVGTIPNECVSIIEESMKKRLSFLVGAKPGGAGKTTIMGAMLSLRPDSEQLIVFNKQNISESKDPNEQKCFVVHEIGSGSWYGYAWGQHALNLLRIPKDNPGAKIAGNLHCDTLQDVKETIYGFNGSESDLNCVDLLIFLEYNPRNRPSRKIKEVFLLENGQFNCVFL